MRVFVKVFTTDLTVLHKRTHKIVICPKTTLSLQTFLHIYNIM
jgi:hypothetical protein